MPLPRWVWLGWLLDLAVECQQFRNWVVSFFDECDCCGGFIISWVKPIEPREYTYDL